MARGRVAQADIRAQQRSEQERQDLLLEKADVDHEDDDDIELAELHSEVDGQTYHFSEEARAAKPVSVLWIAIVLALTVIGFTINIEATAYFEERLGWKKPFAAFYITHSSLVLPWICQMIHLRWRHRDMRFAVWCRTYAANLSRSITTVPAFSQSALLQTLSKRRGRAISPLEYLASTMALVTVVLTLGGGSWFFALGRTTPADLTAIYNCSTFFAAVFSVPILGERLSWLSALAVTLSIIGTLVITYGDTSVKATEDDPEAAAVGTSRLLGNLIAIGGSIAFGLYEVLFKKWAGSSASEVAASTPVASKTEEDEAWAGEGSESLTLTLAASALTGFYTLTTLWIGLVVMHMTGFETFEAPSAWAALWLVIAVLTGSFSITLLVLLIIWTDPVFGSMANVLTVFVVALADWLVWGSAPSLATYIGGALICVAFAVMSKDSFGGGAGGSGEGHFRRKAVNEESSSSPPPPSL